MAYFEQGEGSPILFLHQIPTRLMYGEILYQLLQPKGGLLLWKLPDMKNPDCQ